MCSSATKVFTTPRFQRCLSHQLSAHVFLLFALRRKNAKRASKQCVCLRRPSRTFPMISLALSFSPGHCTGGGLGATIGGTAGLTDAGTAGLTDAGTAGLTNAGLLNAGRLNVVAGGLNVVRGPKPRFKPCPLGLKPGLATPLVATAAPTAPHATLLITGAVASSTPARIKPSFLP